MRTLVFFFQVDEFEIEAVTLKTVNKVKIGHNDSGVGKKQFFFYYRPLVTVAQLLSFPEAEN